MKNKYKFINNKKKYLKQNKTFIEIKLILKQTQKKLI
jgi:hypothetical protein